MKKLLIGAIITVTLIITGCGDTISPELDFKSSNEKEAEVSSDDLPESNTSQSSAESSAEKEKTESSNSSVAENNDPASSSSKTVSSSSSKKSDDASSSSKEIDSSSSKTTTTEESSSSSKASTVEQPAGDSYYLFNKGLANGTAWYFWAWDAKTQSVSAPDGSEYPLSGDATLHIGEGVAIPFDKKGASIDASKNKSFKIKYSSDAPVKVQILWGVKENGWEENGNPYWDATTYLKGGFLLVENIPASDVSTEFSVDLSDMQTPVSDWFESNGSAPATTDLTQIKQLAIRSMAGTANITISAIWFE